MPDAFYHHPMTEPTDSTDSTPANDPVRDDLLAIDQSSDFGARAARHLREDPVIWLTTVAPSGTPSPNPIWFIWDGAATVTVFSLPDAARVQHLSANPRVALHFGGDGKGGDIVVLTGTAALRPDAPGADAVPEYLTKYDGHITRIGLTPRTFADKYSLPVTITLSRLRGY